MLWMNHQGNIIKGNFSNYVYQFSLKLLMIARIVYHMLKEKTPYQARSAAEYDAQRRQRAIKNLARKAR
jgi:hypothetical protein